MPISKYGKQLDLAAKGVVWRQQRKKRAGRVGAHPRAARVFFFFSSSLDQQQQRHLVAAAAAAVETLYLLYCAGCEEMVTMPPPPPPSASVSFELEGCKGNSIQHTCARTETLCILLYYYYYPLVHMDAARAADDDRGTNSGFFYSLYLRGLWVFFGKDVQEFQRGGERSTSDLMCHSILSRLFTKRYPT